MKNFLEVVFSGIAGVILTLVFQYFFVQPQSFTFVFNGQEIIVTEESYKEINQQKEELQKKLDSLNEKYSSLESQNNELISKYNVLVIQSDQEKEDFNMQLSDMPVIDYKNLALCIDVDNIKINSNKSVVTIDGRDFFSKEIVEKLITEDRNLTIKDGTIYIGQVVAEKAKLTDQFLMGNVRCSIEDSSVDSHGNTQTNSIVLGTGGFYNDSEIKYSVGGKYNSLKGTISVASKSGMNSKGTITIKADDEVIYSAELNKDFKPEVIDRPINNCDIIDISYNGYTDFFIIFSDATLYNE